METLSKVCDQNALILQLCLHSWVLTLVDASTSQSTRHLIIQRAMVQGALVDDIQQLSRIASELERKLLAKRRIVWPIHTSLYAFLFSSPINCDLSIIYSANP